MIYKAGHFEKVLELTGIKGSDLSTIFSMMDKAPRFYHTSAHVMDLVEKIIGVERDVNTARNLFFCAIFHDFIYDPYSSHNEEDSAEAFLKFCGQEGMLLENSDRQDIYQTILDTKEHKPHSELSEKFCHYDLSIFADNFSKIIEFEKSIRKEYAFVDWNIYKEKRIQILSSFRKHPLLIHNPDATLNIENLINLIRVEMPKIAVYAGSFHPFHVGHLNIYHKAERIFDKVILAIGQNPAKQNHLFVPSAELYYKQIDVYHTSLVSYINSKKYPITLIRGLRNSTDMQYELNQYRWLQELKPDIDVVSIFCDKEFEYISSSAINTLQGYEDYNKVVKELIV